VLQTHGRNGQYNPHLHIIATSGGLDEESQKWVHLNYLPYRMLHKKWQWYLLEMLREQLDTDEIDKSILGFLDELVDLLLQEVSERVCSQCAKWRCS
jgi:hypothetical protein